MHRTLLSIGGLAVLIAFVSQSVSAQDSAFIDPLRGGSNNFYEDEVETTLAPSEEAERLIGEALREIEPRVGIEIYVEIPVDRQLFSTEGRLALYNILRSPGTMEGIEYYSASRGRMRTFYEESYAIASPDQEIRIPDPVVEEIPETDTIWAFQRDLSFGRNVQRLEYTTLDDGFLVMIENETTMVYRVVPLVFPGNLRTFLYVQLQPNRGTVEFYGNLAVRVPAMFGLQDRARDSFYNRVVALHGWFATELERAGLAGER